VRFRCAGGENPPGGLFQFRRQLPIAPAAIVPRMHPSVSSTKYDPEAANAPITKGLLYPPDGNKTGIPINGQITHTNTAITTINNRLAGIPTRKNSPAVYCRLS